MKVSTALRNALLSGDSLKATLEGFVIRIYEGTPPASPDDAISAPVQLVEISLDGTGNALSFEPSASGGNLAKNASEVWEGNVSRSGLAEFFRIVKPADSANSSTSAVRIQGTVGKAGEDMNFSDPSLSQNAVQRVEFLNIAMPVA